MCYKENHSHALGEQAGGLIEMGGQRRPLQGAGF